MFLYALTLLVIFNVITQDAVQAALPILPSSDDDSAPKCNANTKDIAPPTVCQTVKANGKCGMIGMDINCKKTCFC